jgi:hypothetical protein
MLSNSIQAPKIAEPLQNHQQQIQTSQNQILDTPINSRRPRARHFSARSNRSRSSSHSRVSHSRRSSIVFSDNEATEELSNCVRDLVNEVRELVNSRNPSPLQNQRYKGFRRNSVKHNSALISRKYRPSSRNKIINLFRYFQYKEFLNVF